MPGLSAPAPPAPRRALHEAEIAAAAQAFEREFGGAIDALITLLFFPHSEYWLGTGSAINATTHQVTATLHGGAGSPSGPGATYATGTGTTPALASLRTKVAVLIIEVLKDDPPTFQRYFDGLLEGQPSPATPQPAPLPQPTTPAAVPIRRETVAQYIRENSVHFVDVVRWYLKRELTVRFLSTATRFRWGQVQSVSVSAKTAHVKWDATDESVDPPTETVAFGTRKWTAAQLVGKRVRVAVTPNGQWIDGRDVASGRPA